MSAAEAAACSDWIVRAGGGGEQWLGAAIARGEFEAGADDGAASAAQRGPVAGVKLRDVDRFTEEDVDRAAETRCLRRVAR